MILVDNVSKYYGAQRAVSELSFEIGEGECVGFLGLNGAGKSTTLRLLSCLLLPTSGRITVRGLDVVERPHDIRRLIGYLPDSPPLYDDMRVDDYLAFAGQIRGMSGAALRRGTQRARALCGLDEVADAPIATLSHGYRQRVGIAQAVIHGPSLLILDEPIQGLDPVQIVEMRKMIGELRGEHTILLSTHILTEIEQTCDRILVMHRGRIAASGSEEELAERLSHGDRLELEVRGGVAAVQAALEGLVSDPDALRLEPLEGGVVRVGLGIDRDRREVVSRAIVEAGLGLLSMQIVGHGLEGVFLELSDARASLRPRTSDTGGAP